eukprot:6188517-Pleurochrysis_carterae.AAC.3
MLASPSFPSLPARRLHRPYRPPPHPFSRRPACIPRLYCCLCARAPQQRAQRLPFQTAREREQARGQSVARIQQQSVARSAALCCAAHDVLFSSRAHALERKVTRAHTHARPCSGIGPLSFRRVLAHTLMLAPLLAEHCSANLSRAVSTNSAFPYQVHVAERRFVFKQQTVPANSCQFVS